MRCGGSLRRGFSLIEILVATAVLCVLVVLLNQIIASTMEVVGQGQRHFEIHSKARAALDLLARDLGMGLYRPDVALFEDDKQGPALAFFTRRGGTVPTGAESSDFRQLSYVVYQALDDESSGFSLWRGSINVEWDATGTYPAVSALDGPMPFSEKSVSEGYKAATDRSGTFEPILKGVMRLEIRFLANDGRYYARYNNDATAGPVAKAAVVTLLVMDERAEAILRQNPTLLVSFRQNFLSSSYLTTPGDSNDSLAALWEEKLGQPAIWSGLPERFRSGISTVERVVPLR